MNKNNLRLVIVLVVLIIIYLIGSIRIKKETSKNLFAVDSVKIAFIEIKTASGSITLNKENDNWKITSPYALKSDQRKVDAFFNKVLKAKYLSSPVAETKTSLSKFRIDDSTGVLLTLSDASHKVLSENYFARSSNNAYCYTRKKGDVKVYQVAENISNLVNTDLASWREKMVFSFPEEQLRSINVNYKGNTYTLSKADSVWTCKSIAHGKFGEFTVSPQNEACKEMLGRMAKMYSSTFEDGKFTIYEKYFLLDPLSVTITKTDGSEENLQFAVTDDKRVLLMVNNEKEHLAVVTSDLPDLFKKSAEQFQK